ncbi:MAG: arginine--tRNA ligase [Bacteroidales bacterium]|jgi:arginyl-tRNA synthetase|nr:arginine--tRNA ligase [Bacteroidales bacterium]
MIDTIIQESAAKAFRKVYSAEVESGDIIIQKTRRDFEGDFTINVFPFLKLTREKPEISAEKIGAFMIENAPELERFNVIKGFLNIVVKPEYWSGFLSKNFKDPDYGIRTEPSGTSVVIEYSSPNTNKPLHLGHIRNNLIGWSVAEILKANGHQVIKVNLINDRGIHICKSMLAWKKWFDGKTPEKEGIKGDKLVGDCYVRFDRELKSEIAGLVQKGLDREEAEKEAPLMAEARKMLQDWEKEDPDIRGLWKQMNNWVYDGFDKTYERLGVDFDNVYYESDTYLLGKEIVEEGLTRGVLFKKDDGSIWADLSDEGLDEKLLLRADGTSVYMTQDLGTAQLRHDDYNPDKLLYVVGNEQNYHFDVLKIVLKKLGRDWAEGITHVSYGMVELPHGKMKSREGTVVDADDLMEEMHATAAAMAKELGKADDLSDEESSSLFEMISLGALKYFILRVDPKKNMLFNPEESIDFNGNTGPFIQYTHARIRSLLKKATDRSIKPLNEIFTGEMQPKEIEILKMLYSYTSVVADAGTTLSPATIASYAYDLAKEYNQFYQEISILKEEDLEKARFRLTLSLFTASVIRSAMFMLGIEVPDKM